MTARSFVGLFLLLWGPAPLYAESACVVCRKNTLVQVQACIANAKTEPERSACTKKGQDLTKACDDGPCASELGK
jgi:hypothetical protein